MFSSLVDHIVLLKYSHILSLTLNKTSTHVLQVLHLLITITIIYVHTYWSKKGKHERNEFMYKTKVVTAYGSRVLCAAV